MPAAPQTAEAGIDQLAADMKDAVFCVAACACSVGVLRLPSSQQRHS